MSGLRNHDRCDPYDEAEQLDVSGRLVQRPGRHHWDLIQTVQLNKQDAQEGCSGEQREPAREEEEGR